MNLTVVRQIYNGLLEPMIIEMFEEIKTEKIQKAKDKAKEKDEEFKMPKIGHVTLNDVNLKLLDNYIAGVGEASYKNWDIDFELRFRFISKYVEGSTAFLYNHANQRGMKIEMTSIDLDKPWELEFLEVMSAVSGIGYDPVVAFLSVVVLAILESVAADKMSLGTKKIYKGVVKRLVDFNGNVPFQMRDIEDMVYRIHLLDVLVDTDGLETWASMGPSEKQEPRIQLKGNPGQTVWPVHVRDPIVVELEYELNFSHPDERCRMVDRYTTKLGSDDLTYLDQLPFPENEMIQNLKNICPYCFFGGPDKVPESGGKQKMKLERTKYNLGNIGVKKRKRRYREWVFKRKRNG